VQGVSSTRSTTAGVSLTYDSFTFFFFLLLKFSFRPPSGL